MRHLVILNPASSRGSTSGSEDKVRAALARHGLDHDVVVTRGPGHAAEAVTAHHDTHEGVVAIGGDGTVHEVLQALDLDRQRLGVVPSGSGNDWAWALEWPLDLDGCLARIARGEERRIDLGVWGERRFHNSIGLGFEAEVNEESHRIRRLRGSSIYLAATLRCLLRRRRYRVSLTWDDGRWEGDALLCSIGNGRRVGGRFVLFPDARLDDGALDVFLVHSVGFFPALALLYRTLRGRPPHSSRTRAFRTRTLTLECPDGIPVHIDGEYATADAREVKIHVEAGRLRTF